MEKDLTDEPEMIFISHRTPSEAIQCPMCQRGEPCLANDRILRDKERDGQIENFEHLLETLEQGDLETAKDWVRMAIKKLDA